nr:SMP-30/gluconolactonase/LRE family protein [Chelativorans sp.]
MNTGLRSSSPSAVAVHDARLTGGESLVWCERDKALFLIAIVGRTIPRFRPSTGEFDTWAAPEFATSIGIRRTGGFIVDLSAGSHSGSRAASSRPSPCPSLTCRATG